MAADPLFLHLRTEGARLEKVDLLVPLSLELPFFPTSFSVLAVRRKALHRLLMNGSELLLVLMILLLLVSVPFFLVLLEGIDLWVQRGEPTLLASLGSRHHLVVQLGVHLVWLLPFLASATSFRSFGE